LYANRPDFTAIDRDLATVLHAWPTLPAALKAGIVAIVEATVA